MLHWIILFNILVGLYHLKQRNVTLSITDVACKFLPEAAKDYYTGRVTNLFKKLVKNPV